MATRPRDYSVGMFASGVWGNALIAESDRVVLIGTIGAALIGAIFMVITTMMNNASANRRHRMDLRQQQKRSGMVGFLFVAIVILIAAGVYVATRTNKKTEVASAGPAPPTTIAANTSPTTTTPAPTLAPTNVDTAAAPACAAFTVQIAAIRDANSALSEFETEAQTLAQSLPLGELHRDAGEACGASGRIQFYFGPFANEEVARESCFGIGQVLHDNPASFAQFKNSQGRINYPYYRVDFKVPAQDSKGDTLVCDPELNQ